jgi:formylglycine-generating enzyme
MSGNAIVRTLLMVAVVGAAVVARADVFNMPSGQTSVQFVPVGNAGNAADTTGYGSVGYDYSMGKYDVTVGQYCQFLNAVAKTDTYGLYDIFMGMVPYSYSTIKITRSGSWGSYSYAVTGSYTQAANCPIFYVGWGDAARFCNWLQNGQPTGDQGNGTTETGAYTLDGATTYAALMAVTRNAGATYFIPTENEWYKAAYYKGGGTNAGYWLYPTQSNTAPDNSLALATTEPNDANYHKSGYTDPTNILTPVGTFSASPGPYGTYDMGGDVWQWNETAVSSSSRGLRGGDWSLYSDYLASSCRFDGSPTCEYNNFGFRVASVPEPDSLTLVACGAVAALLWWRGRK